MMVIQRRTPIFGVGAGVLVAGALIAMQLLPQQKSHTIMFINTSISARPQLPGFLRVAVDIISGQARSASPVTVYRFDSHVEEFQDGNASGQTEALEKSLAQQLRATSGEDNTYTDKVFAEVLRRTKYEHMPITIVLLTDGYSEGLTHRGHIRIRHAAAALARNPWVTGIAVLGAKSPAWAEIREDLSPLQQRLRRRFLLQNDTDINSSEVLALIKSAGEHVDPATRRDSRTRP